MRPDDLKKMAAEAALQYISQGMTVGVGTGSTVQYFIEALATIKHKLEGTVASSIATERLLKQYHIPVYDLNSVNTVDLYVDGADEATVHHHLIKGRGGALLREKIIATAAKQFVCIIDEKKQVDILGKDAPVPIEVVPMARGYVARQLVKIGADPVYREGYQTDNGNIILDVYNLKILHPTELESTLKIMTGVVETGIFAHRPADIILIGTQAGILKI